MAERTISTLKESYKKIEEQFQLPSFEKMLEDFEIDKLLEKEDGLLIRDIRRIAIDKIANYQHLFEMLINPSSPPMFVFSFMKHMTENDKKEIREIYKELSKIQIKNIKIDTVYEEKTEAEFIKLIYKEWQSLKNKIFVLVGKFEEEFEKNSEVREKTYFG
jgi:hypothetical protein